MATPMRGARTGHARWASTHENRAKAKRRPQNIASKQAPDYYAR